MNGLTCALGLFTVVPVRAKPELARADAAAALRWLPVIGGALGAAAALPFAAALEWAPNAPVLGAVAAVALLALLTRGLHLDGLADTADGLGSRAPAEQALEIMRRSDIGPFGVLAIVFAVLVDVAALASLGGGVWRPVAALAVAAGTGRLAVLFAAHRRVPSARASGFGSFVAGSVSSGTLVGATAAVLGAGAVLAWAVDASVLGWPAAQAVALLLSAAVRVHATRRLGGVTGDVFGALIEIGTALTLAGLAVTCS
jgi:adenosylcobinamide-GDP ribazoletransferase